jgi:hypothetical protein
MVHDSAKAVAGHVAASAQAMDRKSWREVVMKRLLMFVAATVGGSIGWWIGAFVGVFTAFVVSCIGTGFGMYYGQKAVRRYLE